MTEREKWLERRMKGIGGSDAAAVAGLSPFKTNVQLWEEKTGRKTPPDISDNPLVKYGHDAEPHMRELFKLDFPEYIVSYDEFGMISNNKSCQWAFATLDAELIAPDGQKGVFEGKTCTIQRSNQWKEWDGKIPNHYYIQVLHQLLATEYTFTILKARLRYTDRSGDLQASVRHYKIDRVDVESDIEWLADKEAAFWKCVETDTRPALILPEI